MAETLTHLDALELLVTQYAGDIRLRAFLGAHLLQAQEIEDAAHAVADSRDVDLATGHALDMIGRVVGQLRYGFSDDIYRVFIKARALVNAGNSRAPEIIALLQATASGGAVAYHERYPAGFEAQVDGVDSGVGQAIRRLVQALSGAGIGVNFVYTDLDSTGSFHYGPDSPGYTSTNDPVSSPGGGYARS